jgi:predicted regulator of Ras-like GTPase activity (Roadblock/LC7/MglB family)
MMFTEILKQAVENVDGVVGALIVGSDGITVEDYLINSPVDSQSLGAEYSTLLKDVERASESLGLGVAKEISVISEGCIIVMRRINREYFIVLIMKPEANFGKGRFYLRRAVPKLEKEF